MQWTQDQLVHYLKKTGIVSSRYEVKVTDGFIRIQCPFAKWTHKSGENRSWAFAISLSDEPFYMCWRCKKTGSYSQLFKSLAAYEKDPKQKEVYLEVAAEVYGLQNDPAAIMQRALDKYEQEEPIEELPDMSALKKWFEAQPTTGGNSKEYIAERTDPELVDAYGFRYDPFEERLMMPVFTLDGTFGGVVGRSLKHAFPPWKTYWGTKKTWLFGRPYADINTFQAIRETFDWIILQEGPFDMIRTWQNLHQKRLNQYLPMNIFGSKLSSRQRGDIEELQMPVLLMMDPDPAGYQATKEVVKQLRGRVPQVAVPDLKEYRKITYTGPEGKLEEDYNSSDFKDPGELTPDEFIEVFKSIRIV